MKELAGGDGGLTLEVWLCERVVTWIVLTVLGRGGVEGGCSCSEGRVEGCC